MLYVGRAVEVTESVASKLKFACAECGFESKVWAIGRGRGAARDPFFLDTDATERAHERSYYAAHESAREAVRLTCCPRCMARSRSAVVWFWVKHLAKALLVGGVLAFAGLMVRTADMPGMGNVILWVGAPLSVLLMVLTETRPRWRSIEARVLFDPPRLEHRRRYDERAGEEVLAAAASS